MPSLPQKLTFVDVETTGLYPSRDRVIEIGIIRVEDGQITDQFSHLVNPERPVPTFIQGHTQISNEMVATAPTFAELEAEISQLLTDSVFIAHNVHFDYGFLRYEYARVGKQFQAPLLCTVQLFRRFYPRLRSHSLDSLIRNFQFSCQNRHRALDDVTVLWQFYQQLVDRFPPEQILAHLSP